MGGTVIKPEAQIILERGKERMAVNLAEMGMEPEKIAQAAEVDLDTVREWIGRKAVAAK